MVGISRKAIDPTELPRPLRDGRGGGGGACSLARSLVLLALFAAAAFAFRQNNRLVDQLKSLSAASSASASGPASTAASVPAPSPPSSGRGDGDDFALAYRESLGFFDDVPSKHWELMKTKVREMSPNFNTFYLPHEKSRAVPGDKRNNNPGYFYQNHYEPDFVCQHERRVGECRENELGTWRL